MLEKLFAGLTECCFQIKKLFALNKDSQTSFGLFS